MKELRLTATRESLDQVNAFLETELENYECPPRVTMQLLVALEELYVNIASYAYAPDTGEALIRIDYNDGMLTVELIDWGKPFDPLAREDPDITLSAEERDIGGLGIFMVKKSMDIFTYERRDGQNIVTIGRKLAK